MTLERPPRLKDGELGPILRSAGGEMSPQRIAENGARVKQLIAAGSTFALWKLLLVLGLIGALGVPLAIRALRSDDAPAVARGVPADALPALPADSEVVQIELDAEVASIEPAPPAPLHHVHAPPAPHDASEATPAVAEPAPSDLPAQIELYNAARAAAAAHDYALAIDRIDELFRRFPATQLRADAELTRAEMLARANRLPEAIVAFDALAADDAHRGRRGELLRTLGDLLRTTGDCTRAVEVYKRALAEKLSERDRVHAEHARDHCQVP